MDEAQIIDHAAHERLLEWGGNELLNAMVGLFLEHVSERVERISSGLDAAKANEVEYGAHSLKSSAANVGAERVRSLAQEIEDLASMGDLDGVRGLHERLRTAVADADARLREMEGITR
jgi:HPt (histidine-containing phosphotransfer) domain-containing protein